MNNWKVPAGTLILPTTAPRQDCLNMRTKGIGGSDIATITRASTYTTPYGLWAEKTASTDPVEKVADILWFGQEVEPVMAARFTADTGIETRNVGMYQSKEHPFMLANPDRLTSDGGILEIKTTTRFTQNGKDYLAGVVPTAHRYQVLWYMFVTGRHVGHVIALVDRQVVILSVEWDAATVDHLIGVGSEFWAHVESLTPPLIDLAEVTEDEVKDRFPTIESEDVVEAVIPEATLEDHQHLTDLKARKAEIEAQVKEIETRVKATIGDHEYLAVGGRPLFRWQEVAGRKSFDKPSVLAKIAAERGLEPTKQVLADIEAEFTKVGSPSRRLSILEGKVA